MCASNLAVNYKNGSVDNFFKNFEKGDRH